MASQHKYLDILLFDYGDSEKYAHFLSRYTGGLVWLSGRIESTLVMQSNPYVLGVCGSLEVNSTQSIVTLMDELSKVIARSKNDQLAILRLTNLFVNRNNTLCKCMYVIKEMFCSRRINYSEYENVEVLIRSVNETEAWLEDYIKECNNVLSLSYVEMFTIVFLQNLIDEGYIKARRRGGYDTSLMFRNANYILNSVPRADAVHLLKLQILHNSVNFNERPDEILRIISEQSAPEYISRAFCEVGDIYREDKSKIADRRVTEYYEEADQDDIDTYRSLYRAGLVYEEEGKTNFICYEMARKKYDQVIGLIERIDLLYRTPQEFEYFYKACYGKIKMSIEIDREKGTLTQERKDYYQDKLQLICEDCVKFQQILFFHYMYKDDLKEIESLMEEKMKKVENWAKNLMKKVI